MEALRAALGLGIIVIIAWTIYYAIISITDLIGNWIFGRQHGNRRR